MDQQTDQYTENEPYENSKNTKTIWIAAVAVIITTLITGGGVYAWQNSSNKSIEQNLQQQITLLQNQISELKEAQKTQETTTQETTIKETNTPVANTNSDWQTYEDKNSGFSLKYPKTIPFKNQPGEDYLSLSVESRKINSLDYPMGYDKETALNDEKELAKGNYGKGPDSPLSVSKKIKNLGFGYGQDFVVLSRIDTCDVTFERKLVFYRNGYQIIVTLNGNKDNIISNNSEYFKTDQACGNDKIWNFEKQTQFYKNLQANILSIDAKNWFNLFDDIVNTIKIK